MDYSKNCFLFGCLEFHLFSVPSRNGVTQVRILLVVHKLSHISEDPFQ